MTEAIQKKLLNLQNMAFVFISRCKASLAIILTASIANTRAHDTWSGSKIAGQYTFDKFKTSNEAIRMKAQSVQ
jgi:hypothetical protein